MLRRIFLQKVILTQSSALSTNFAATFYARNTTPYGLKEFASLICKARLALKIVQGSTRTGKGLSLKC
jgi:hypothetical protein